MSWIDTVNTFWFEELESKEWFSARPKVDETIRERFGGLHAALRREPPAMKSLNPAGHVAAVIVFDQFSRNLFRGSAQTYATDDLALALATHAVDRGLDTALGARQRQFLYMPFMHSEDRATQALSMQLFRALADLDVLRYAEHHATVVDRFGRFPHRNEILGRATTDAEREFLRNEH